MTSFSRKSIDPDYTGQCSKQLHPEPPPPGIKQYWLIAIAFALAILVYYYQFNGLVWANRSAGNQELGVLDELDHVLMKAAMPNKTVIICQLNKAWIEKDSMFDMFIESFRIGNQTAELLKHLVVAAFDNEAFDHCLRLNMSFSCYNLTDVEGTKLSNEARFGTPNYLRIVWRKVGFLSNVLEKGYNFIYTDVDVMWFRNPLLGFLPDTEFQVSSDVYVAGITTDAANTGVMYIKSSNRTIAFTKFWYALRANYSSYAHDQDAFRIAMHDPFLKKIGLEIKCLDTIYFGGFCSRNIDLRLVYTVHAICCVGLPNKLHDLRLLRYQWKNYTSLPDEIRNLHPATVSVPQHCG